MLGDCFGYFENAKLLLHHLFGVSAYNQMNLVRGTINLLE
jgi:hypothetical protein